MLHFEISDLHLRPFIAEGTVKIDPIFNSKCMGPMKRLVLAGLCLMAGLYSEIDIVCYNSDGQTQNTGLLY